MDEQPTCLLVAYPKIYQYTQRFLRFHSDSTPGLCSCMYMDDLGHLWFTWSGIVIEVLELVMAAVIARRQLIAEILQSQKTSKDIDLPTCISETIL